MQADGSTRLSHGRSSANQQNGGSYESRLDLRSHAVCPLPDSSAPPRPPTRQPSHDSDDRLAQLCQMQIFFSLVSSLLLKWDKVAAEQEGNRGTQNLDVLVRAARSFSIPARSFSHMLTRPQTVRVSPPAQLCTFTFLPVAFGLITHFLSEGLYDYFKEGWIDPAKEWLRPRLEPMLIGARRIHRLRGSASSKSFVRPWLRVTCGGSSTECWRKTRTAISPTMGSGEL